MTPRLVGAYPRLPDSLPLPESVREVTPGQIRVIAAYMRHGTIKEAAAALGITVNTAKNHLTLAYARLNVPSIIGAANALGWCHIPGDDELVVMSDAFSAKNRLRDAIDEAQTVLDRLDERPS